MNEDIWIPYSEREKSFSERAGNAQQQNWENVP